MPTEQEYIIQIIKIEPIDIDDQEVDTVKQTILRQARGLKIGLTDLDVFEEFAIELEYEFGAERSSYTGPFEGQTYWNYHLPIDGNFDVSPSQFTISFHIKRWTDIVDTFKHILEDYSSCLEYDEVRSKRHKALCAKVTDMHADRDFIPLNRDIREKLKHSTGINFIAAGVTNADPNPLMNFSWFSIRVNWM